MPFDGTVASTPIDLPDVVIEPRSRRGWPRTRRQLEWALLYVMEGLSAHAAALNVDYSPETAKARSCELTRTLQPFIAYLQTHKNRIVEANLEVSVDRVLREAAAIALSDLVGFKRVVCIDGQERWIGKKPGDLTPLQRIAVSSWSEAEVPTDDGVEIDYRYRLHDKAKALLFVGRHLGMFSETLIVEARTKREEVELVDYSNVPHDVLTNAIAAMKTVHTYINGDKSNTPPNADKRMDTVRQAYEARRLSGGRRYCVDSES